MISIPKLRTEVLEDPLELGLSFNDLPGALEQLSTPGTASAPIARRVITAKEILENIRPNDFYEIANDGSSDRQGQARLKLLELILTVSNGVELDYSDQQIRAQLKSCFPRGLMAGGQTTTTDLIGALDTIDGASRSEELFGQGVFPALRHMVLARDYGAT